MSALDDAQKMVDQYIQAEAAILSGKSVTWQGRTVSMENLTEIRAGRKEWEARVAALATAAAAGGSRGNGYSFARFIDV